MALYNEMILIRRSDASMRNLLKTILISSFILGAVACGAAATATLTPTSTPDIEATIRAGIEQTKAAVPTSTPDIEATVQARIEQIKAALPTATPTPAPTATPEPTATPVPTATPTPTSTPAITLSPVEIIAIRVIALDYLTRYGRITIQDLIRVARIDQSRSTFFFKVMVEQRVLRRFGSHPNYYYRRY